MKNEVFSKTGSGQTHENSYKAWHFSQLFGSSDGQSPACTYEAAESPSCTFTAAVTPTCDLLLDTDGSAECFDGCSSTLQVCEAALTCTGTANVVPATCTGTAVAVPASCSGAEGDQGEVCDLDLTTDETAECPTGCTLSEGYIPECDLRTSTDNTGACLTDLGCVFVAATTPVCELENGVCPAGCDGQAASDCPFGCTYAPQTDDTNGDRLACEDANAACVYVPAGSGAGAKGQRPLVRAFSVYNQR